jgi:hypothetical protein
MVGKGGMVGGSPIIWADVIIKDFATEEFSYCRHQSPYALKHHYLVSIIIMDAATEVFSYCRHQSPYALTRNHILVILHCVRKRVRKRCAKGSTQQMVRKRIDRVCCLEQHKGCSLYYA